MLLILSSIDCKKNPIIPGSGNSTDTTSHEFTFQTFTFGGGGGSILNDVAIINDTLVYAVGAIYLTDSTGQYDPPYNLAIWNGTGWNVKRVTVNFRGNLITPPLYGIYAFSKSQIWLAGDLAIYGTDNEWTPYDVRLLTGYDTLLAEKCWGLNPSEMYFVGLHGTLVHYDGNSWTKLQSGTTLPINDIWGSQNSQTGQLEILAVAADDMSKKLLRIQGTTVSTLPDSGLSASLYGVWFVPEEKYYVVGAGIGYKNSLDNSSWSVYPSGVVTSYMSGGVRGTGMNDVFVAGSFFEIVHYNGSSWHNYKDVISFTDGAVGRIAVKGNLMVTVGLSGQNAVAIIGKRE
jgi:hypothetical protein